MKKSTFQLAGERGKFEVQGWRGETVGVHRINPSDNRYSLSHLESGLQVWEFRSKAKQAERLVGLCDGKELWEIVEQMHKSGVEMIGGNPPRVAENKTTFDYMLRVAPMESKIWLALFRVVIQIDQLYEDLS